MATKELRKKRGSVTLSPARKSSIKEKEETLIVQPAPSSAVDNEDSKTYTTPEQPASSMDESKEENTKDTGQEKDSGTPRLFDKKKGAGVMDSPRYSRSKEKARERSSSPFRRNVVEPLAAGADGGGAVSSSQGSLVSLRSQVSTTSKEAWPERKDSVSTVKSKASKDSTFKPNSRPTSAKEEGTGAKETQIETVSIKAEEREQNAYIPFTYARNCIARMTGDITSMKEKHLRIVHDITQEYKAIEDETQAQFNVFVLSLRRQYAGKLTTFKKVTELYATQHARKEQYWKETMQSLTERMNKMLKDRKILLVSNREEVEKLEHEKTQLMAQLTAQMDQEKSAATLLGKDLEKKIKELEGSNEKLQGELDAEKAEVQRLKALVAAGTATAIVTTAISKEESKKEEAPVDRSASPKDRVSEKERERMSNERHQMEEDMGRWGEERHELMNKVKQLQDHVSALSLENGSLQEKNRLLLVQAEEAARVREQYAKLESQYNALALLVKVSPEVSQAAKEKEDQVEKERTMMEEERHRLAKEIEKWEKEFKKKNKREPTEKDKPDSAKELYTSMGEVEYMVDNLDRQKETLQAVQAGAAPPAPDLPPPNRGAVLDPEVSVVEVKVPDPEIVALLEKSQAAVDDLQLRLAALQEENADLQSRLADSKASAPPAALVVQGEDTEKLEKLTAELDEKDDELERLRVEKREMAKDMKKMMRQHAKLQAKMAEMDPDLPKLLEMVAVVVQSIHGEHDAAGRAIEKRLKTATEALKPMSEKDAAAKKALHVWDNQYKKIHGSAPDEADRDKEGQKLKAASDDSGKALEIRQLEVRALTLLTTGIFNPQKQPKSASRTTPETDVEQQLSAMDNKLIDLEGEKEQLIAQNSRLQNNIEDLESQIQDLKEQLAYQAAVGAAAVVGSGSEDAVALEREIDGLNTALQQEKATHDDTREELESLQKQLQAAKDELSELQGQSQSQVHTATSVLKASLAAKDEQLAELKKKNEEMERERMANLPIDTAKEIKNLQNRIAMLEREREEMKTHAATQAAAVVEAKSQLDVAHQALGAQRAANRDLEARVKAARAEKGKTVKELTNQIDKKEQQRAALETKIKLLQASGSAAVASTAAHAKGASARGAAGTAAGKGGALTEETAALKREIKELNAKTKQLETDVRGAPSAGGAGDSLTEKNQQKRHEKILKELEKRLEIEFNKNGKLTEAQKQKDEELKVLNKDVKDKDAEIAKLKAELAMLGVAAKEGVEAAGKVKALEVDNKKLVEENKVLTENYNSERVLRKKYYNMVEDMKGKIRVYCRARPLSSSESQRGNFSVLKSPDEYSIQVATAHRGLKEFQFDQVFMEDSTQEKVFEDTNNLIQSAVDGYNVCIFAYGQTGSGKTFTMIGDQAGNFPGIAPRAFDRIFELAEENKGKIKMTVTTYMLELYNDKLIDLYARPDTYDEDKLEVKKDKKGLVYVQGAVVKPASNAKELYALFEAGSKNRHTASTKMNAESSRSHLVVGVVMESTNKSTGNVVKGKLSLVDLAGSERVGKTGASAETLKEAMSINKSLSALGDVISALSSDQQFIPYRNSKLTMLMQDSLGGNAKTLMFVNISPADYNADETVVSLMYASRVKLITNDASKNADNKEIARLKAVIAKLKKGEKVDEEEETV